MWAITAKQKFIKSEVEFLKAIQKFTQDEAIGKTDGTPIGESPIVPIVQAMETMKYADDRMPRVLYALRAIAKIDPRTADVTGEWVKRYDSENIHRYEHKPTKHSLALLEGNLRTLAQTPNPQAPELQSIANNLHIAAKRSGLFDAIGNLYGMKGALPHAERIQNLMLTKHGKGLSHE